ncbi:MAG: ribose 5-phosphate isomerase B [Anaerolineales bacterium]
MTLPSDSELQSIVRRVVKRTISATLNASLAGEGKQIGARPPRGVAAPLPERDPAPPEGIVALGADHGGFQLKEIIKKHLEEKGYTLIDCGTHGTQSVDYPDFARVVAVLVGEGKAWRGIMIDGAGIGSCMVANKLPGVRASMCYDHATAHNAREHNDANVLTLGAGLIGVNLAKQIVDTWLTTPFAGGRHARRVEKIVALDPPP